MLRYRSNVIPNRGLLTECEKSPDLSSVEILPPYGRQNDISVGMGFFTSLRSVQNDIRRKGVNTRQGILQGRAFRKERQHTSCVAFGTAMYGAKPRSDSRPPARGVSDFYIMVSAGFPVE